jgi:hypothetical protein
MPYPQHCTFPDTVTAYCRDYPVPARLDSAENHSFVEEVEQKERFVHRLHWFGEMRRGL